MIRKRKIIILNKKEKKGKKSEKRLRCVLTGVKPYPILFAFDSASAASASISAASSPRHSFSLSVISASRCFPHASCAAAASSSFKSMLSAATQGICPVDFGSKCSLPLPNSTGFVTHSGNIFLRHGMSRGSLVSSCSYSCSPRRLSMVCSAGPNSYRRNQEFSRQQGGRSSRGKSKQYSEREDSENSEDTDFMNSKNGSLLSIANNPRYQATAVPGRREKEIVELFRKVQAQLRDRASNKEEKKTEATQQGQSERGTVDSLLKLLRKHSVDQKKSGNAEDLNLDHADRNNFSEGEQDLNVLNTNNIIKSDDVQEPGSSPSARPVSNFRKRSPVPRVKFQPVFTAEDDTCSATEKSQGSRREKVDKESKATGDIQALMLEEDPEELAVNEQLDNSDSNEAKEEDRVEAKEDGGELSETEAAGSSDLGTLKLTELREIAKSRGIKGYSKLKKVELVELLSS